MLVPPLCWGCGGPARRREPLCLKCRSSLRRLAAEPAVLCGVRVWAPVAYAGPARELVRALKFRGALGVADGMAAQIVAGAPAGWLDSLAPAALVPVPLHPWRVRRRGFNQARVLAAAVGRRAGLAVVDCLVRSGPAGTQVGRGRAERRAGPEGAIAARSPTPARAILVDDVATTGATLAACAAALRAAGAREVAGLAFARTPGR
jgi:ComF family protein